MVSISKNALIELFPKLKSQKQDVYNDLCSIFDRYCNSETNNEILDGNETNNFLTAIKNSFPAMYATVQKNINLLNEKTTHVDAIKRMREAWNKKYSSNLSENFYKKCYAAIKTLNLTVSNEDWAKADKTKYLCKEDLIVDQLLAMMAKESGLNPKKWNGKVAVGLMQMQQDRLDEIHQKNPNSKKFTVKTLTDFSKLSAEEQLDYFIEGIQICKKHYSKIKGSITVDQMYAMNHFPRKGNDSKQCTLKADIIRKKQKDRGELPRNNIT